MERKDAQKLRDEEGGRVDDVQRTRLSTSNEARPGAHDQPIGAGTLEERLRIVAKESFRNMGED